jgi:flagellar basal body P-ring formation protein FlgA
MMMRRILCLLSVSGLLLSGAAPAAGLVTIVEQSRVDRPSIRLGDVFNGIAASDDVEIAVAPLPGRSVTYDYTVLGKLAQRYQLNWQAASLNDKTVITRAAQRITPEAIRTAIIEQLKTRGVSGEIEVVLDQRNLEINLPTTIAPDFALHDFRFDKASQRFTAQLLAGVDTAAFQQMAVTGRATAVVQVPVLNKVLAQGAVIGAGDVTLIAMPLDRAGDYVRTAEAMVGMELRRQIPEQTPLRVQDMLPQRVVHRGNLVTMQVLAAGMQLTAQGRALQDGAIGETIRVTNTQSNRVVDAKVTGAGAVDVTITTQLASAH